MIKVDFRYSCYTDCTEFTHCLFDGSTWLRSRGSFLSTPLIYNFLALICSHSVFCIFIFVPELKIAAMRINN